jgi:hypothetical protein
MQGLILAVALLASAAQPANPPAAEAQVAGPAEEAKLFEKAKASRVVCRQESKANSRFERRICRKQSDWDAATRQAEDDFNRIQNRPQANYSPPGS